MSLKMRVMKFGGTSVGDAACIRRAAEIIAAAGDGPLVAVVSAMGGVTTKLIDAATRSETGDAHAGIELAEALRAQHLSAAETLLSDRGARAEFAGEAERILEEL